MGIVLLTSITLTTIVYSAFNTELQIKGEAMLRVKEEVRVTKLTLTEFSPGAIETFNNKFGKDTTNMYVTIPGNGSMTYEVEITNKSSKDYDVLKVLESTKDNSNLNVTVSLTPGDIINKNSSKKFTIKITNKVSSLQVGNIVYQYKFAEHVNSYVLGNYSNPQMYEVKIPYTGKYKIELWGAQGGEKDDLSAFGGYTSGIISLKENSNIYIFVGGKGKSISSSVYATLQGGFNGGGEGRTDSYAVRYWGSGGGSTDIRTKIGTWDNFDSLKSRIMVAAGGGSFHILDGTKYFAGGSAGGLVGYEGMGPDGSTYGSPGIGGSQISAGYSLCDSKSCSALNHAVGTKLGEGGFGFGGSWQHSANGGGGGYYGGGASGHVQSAGGGSSFISGHNGCDAIKENSTSTNIIHTGQSVHYSGYKFTDTLMIDGKGCKWTDKLTNDCIGQIQPDGTTATGHSGDGYARITFIERVFD